MKFIFFLIGIILVIEGIPYFAFPDKMKIWMVTLLKIPNRSLRISAFLAICTGLMLVYLFRP